MRFSLLAILMSAPALAAPCEAIYSALSDSLVIDVNATVGDIDSLLKAITAKSAIGEKHSEPLIRMALENAVQHGVEDMYTPSAAPLHLSVKRSAGEVEIQITNRTFKTFPARLARTFEPGEALSLTNEERPFPRGFGLGLSQMFRSFSSMPKGSEMGWSTQGNTATFRLKIKLSAQ